MNSAPSSRDLLLLSAYLDGRLSDSEQKVLEERITADVELSSLYHELKHTCSLLRALPAKRAPRNFTLSQKYAVVKPRRWGLSSFMGLASVATALAVMMIFFRVQVFGGMATKTAAQPNLAVPEAASSTALDESGSPMIINWYDFSQVRGMGGGGGEALKVNPPGDNGADALTMAVPEAAPLTASLPEPGALEEPQAVTQAPSAELAATPDPSTLILGLPQPGTEGEVIDQALPETRAGLFSLPSSNLWMIGLGILSVISAVLAIFTRRR